MDRIRQAATMSVARGTGFAGLGIVTLMAGLSYDPVLCASTGAVLSAMVAAVLFFRGSRAAQVPAQRTEAWLLLPPEARPPKALAQRMIAAALREAYFTFGRAGLVAAAVLWLVSVGLRLLPPGG